MRTASGLDHGCQAEFQIHWSGLDSQFATAPQFEPHLRSNWYRKSSPEYAI